QRDHAPRARVPPLRALLLRRVPVTGQGGYNRSDPRSMGATPPSDPPPLAPPPLTFAYRPMPDLDRPLRERLGQYPRVPDMTFDALRTVARWLALGLVRLQFPLEVRGPPPHADRVPLVAHPQTHPDAA